MGTKGNLLSGPCLVYVDEGSGLVDVGYTKGGVKIDVTPKVKTFTVDQEGDSPAVRYISGVECKVMFSLAEYTLPNLKRAFLNAVPLQDDTTPANKKLDIRPLAGKAITGKKWVIKEIDPSTQAATTDKSKWVTIPNGAPSDSTVSISLTTEALALIPVTLECLPDEANKQVQIFFGDETVVDANESGF